MFRRIRDIHEELNAPPADGQLAFDPKHQQMFLPSMGKGANQRDYEQLRNFDHQHATIVKTGRTWMIVTRDGQIFQTAVNPHKNEYYRGV